MAMRVCCFDGYVYVRVPECIENLNRPVPFFIRVPNQIKVFKKESPQAASGLVDGPHGRNLPAEKHPLTTHTYSYTDLKT